MGRIVVGTSSWADPGFVEEWYPADLPARDRLAWYAEHFDAVEVNSTFYAVPAETTVQRWAQETPHGFTFDVKLHRLLSRHSADLKSLPEELRKPAKTTPKGRVKLDDKLQDALVDAVLEAVEPLAGKLSSFLLQLSPGFAPRSNDLDELAPAGAVQVDRGRGGDPVQPRAQVLGVAQPRIGPQGAQQRVLQHVLGLVVAGHAAGMREQLVAVALDEHPEGGKDHIL